MQCVQHTYSEIRTFFDDVKPTILIVPETRHVDKQELRIFILDSMYFMTSETNSLDSLTVLVQCRINCHFFFSFPNCLVFDIFSPVQSRTSYLFTILYQNLFHVISSINIRLSIPLTPLVFLLVGILLVSIGMDGYSRDMLMTLAWVFVFRLIPLQNSSLIVSILVLFSNTIEEIFRLFGRYS